MARNALVTGAGQGIGFGIAKRLSDDGFHVIVTDYDEALARQAASRLGGSALVLDVSDPDSIRVAAAQVSDLGVLVNCAGIYPWAPLNDVPVDQFERVFNINVRGALLAMQAFHSALKADGAGAIVNITSMSADLPSVGVGIYSASKAALKAITRQAAIEYAPDGIRVNAVAPGSIQTEGTNRAIADGGEPSAAPNIPLGRLGSPEDVARVVSFLASEDSQYVTGQSILTDGGFADNTFALYRMASASA